MAEPGTAPVGQPETSVASTAGDEIELTKEEKHLHRILDEKKKEQARRLEAEKRLSEYEAKEKEREEANARKRGDYELLLKQRDEELSQTKQILKEYNSRIEQAEKKAAVIDAIGGNIDPKWHKLIDISGVVVNPDTGEVDALTVSKVAEAFKREFPEAIKRPGQLPASAPQGLEGAGGKISKVDWMKLSSKEMLKWKPDQIID